ncbi:MAG: protein kinase [Peptococcaceae bacterium]|nr:protein kinase [Peptococcaceae bacterium]
MSDLHGASYIKKYEPLWGTWYIEEAIGQGSFGKVYRIRRQQFDKTWYSAVKIISIPQDEAEIQRMRLEGLDDASIREFYHEVARNIISEIDLMREFRGNSHIVSFEDHEIIDKHETLGCDILIRMELLKSLPAHVAANPLTVGEVVKLGVHMCRALELCALKKIIHRDIKAENIFVSPYGEYKLGDFGVARQIEQTMSGLSKKGTYTTMAPEVFNGQQYGASVDTYALGIVMYTLLNQNRAPFLPAYPQSIRPQDRENALQRRMGGEAVPDLRQEDAIPGISPQLNALVLKACAYNRRDRFPDPTVMRKSLEALAAAEGYELDTASINLSRQEMDLRQGQDGLRQGRDGKAYSFERRQPSGTLRLIEAQDTNYTEADGSYYSGHGQNPEAHTSPLEPTTQPSEIQPGGIQPGGIQPGRIPASDSNANRDTQKGKETRPSILLTVLKKHRKASFLVSASVLFVLITTAALLFLPAVLGSGQTGGTELEAGIEMGLEAGKEIGNEIGIGIGAIFENGIVSVIGNGIDPEDENGLSDPADDSDPIETAVIEKEKAVGYGISVNSQIKMTLADKAEAQAVLKELEAHYKALATAKGYSIASVSFEEKVEIVGTEQGGKIVGKKEALQTLIDGKIINVVVKGTYEVSEKIPFTTEKVKDQSMDVGTSATRQKGVQGTKVITWSYTTKNGVVQEKDKAKLKETVTKQPVKEIIAEGNKPSPNNPVAVSGFSSSYYKFYCVATGYVMDANAFRDNLASGQPVRAAVDQGGSYLHQFRLQHPSGQDSHCYYINYHENYRNNSGVAEYYLGIFGGDALGAAPSTVRWYFFDIGGGYFVIANSDKIIMNQTLVVTTRTTSSYSLIDIKPYTGSNSSQKWRLVSV